MPMHQYSITQVDLAVSVVVEADRPPKLVNIRITHPNTCSLKYDELGLTLRDMLNASGIEPREPAEATEPVAAVEAVPANVV